jgi:prolyl 4-hydroxylase
MSAQMQSAGGPRERLRMAQALLIGHGVLAQPERAMQIIRECCAQRFCDALLFHAALAARGVGRPQDLDDAMRYVAEAAAAGDTRAKGQYAALGGKPEFDRATWLSPIELKQHHAAPRVFTVKNFLSKPACSWLIKQARKNLIRAPIQVGEKGGAFAAHADRTNSVAGSNALQPDLVMQLVNLRIAATINVPVANQEPTNILNYRRGEEYKPHFDFITPVQEKEPIFARELETIGQRIATVLVYLNDDYEGGETEFPLLDWRFKGNVGDALIFWNFSLLGEGERLSWHAGKAVTKGEKWLLSKWVRQRPVPLV